MPTVIVFGLTEKISEYEMESIWESLRDAVIKTEGVVIRTRNPLDLFFPCDRIKKGLGEKISIFVEKLEIRESYNSVSSEQIRDRLAKMLVMRMKTHFPSAFVNCTIRLLAPEDGFWSSAEME